VGVTLQYRVIKLQIFNIIFLSLWHNLANTIMITYVDAKNDDALSGRKFCKVNRKVIIATL